MSLSSFIIIRTLRGGSLADVQSSDPKGKDTTMDFCYSMDPSIVDEFDGSCLIACRRIIRKDACCSIARVWVNKIMFERLSFRSDQSLSEDRKCTIRSCLSKYKEYQDS